jgi:crotonobetainyl-CoA:carnitine CoA-transferase CaiB-like acyl-CoA transferase
MTATETETTASAGQPQVFSGLRVLDLSRWVAGEFATKFFGDFGADVVKIEKPGEGSLTRRWGPFPRDIPDPEASALFLHLNVNKRSVALNLACPTGRDLLVRLAATADLIVESFRPGTLERLGLGPAELQQARPSAVVTRISAFGQDGPYRDFEATGLVLQAMGGPMNATGRADLPPHRKPGLLEHYTIGRMAAEASLGGLMSARRSPGSAGPVIDVAGMETLLAGADRRASYLLTAAYSGTNAPRGVRSAHRGAATFTGAYRCLDGFVMLYVTNAEFWARLVDLIAGDDEKFRQAYRGRFDLGQGPDFDVFIDRVRAWFAARPKLEIMELGEARRIPLTAFLDVSELTASPHFRGRGCFVPATHPVAGTLEYLGPPWRMRSGWQLRRPAPLLGADTADLLGEVGIGEPELRALRAQGVI